MPAKSQPCKQTFQRTTASGLLCELFCTSSFYRGGKWHGGQEKLACPRSSWWYIVASMNPGSLLQSCWKLLCNYESGLAVPGLRSIWFQILSPPCLPACLCGNKMYIKNFSTLKSSAYRELLLNCRV